MARKSEEDAMTAALTIPSPPSLPALADMAQVEEFVAESLAPATRRAYRTGLADFTLWTAERGLETLPASPETVAAYLADRARAGLSVSTLQQRLAAIKWAHESQGLETPTAAKGVRATMAGIRRELGVAPKRKAPATVDRLSAMVSHAKGDSRKAIRDRALLLFGFASALRRSELVALQVGDIEETERGLLLTVRRSKTDQEGKGHQRAIPFGRSPETCPVSALRSWMTGSGGIVVLATESDRKQGTERRSETPVSLWG
jgi:site-specific recombinase XerD